jgi:hypothetical protein
MAAHPGARHQTVRAREIGRLVAVPWTWARLPRRCIPVRAPAFAGIPSLVMPAQALSRHARASGHPAAPCPVDGPAPGLRRGRPRFPPGYPPLVMPAQAGIQRRPRKPCQARPSPLSSCPRKRASSPRPVRWTALPPAFAGAGPGFRRDTPPSSCPRKRASSGALGSLVRPAQALSRHARASGHPAPPCPVDGPAPGLRRGRPRLPPGYPPLVMPAEAGIQGRPREPRQARPSPFSSCPRKRASSGALSGGRPCPRLAPGQAPASGGAGPGFRRDTPPS